MNGPSTEMGERRTVRAPVRSRLTDLRSGLRGASKREWLTVAVVLLAALLLAGAVSGYLTVKVFHQFSLLKWLTLLVAPLLVVILLVVKRPSLWATGLLMFTIPVEPYVATIHGQPVSILLVTAVVATLVVTLEGGVRLAPGTRTPAIARVLPWILVLMILPIALGVAWEHQVLYLALIIDVVWIVMRVVALYPDGRLAVALIFVGTAAFQATVAVAQYVTHSAFNLYGGAGTATYSSQTYFFDYGTNIRTTGTFFDPISLGNVLAMAVPIALVLALRSELRMGYRWFAGIAGGIIMAGLTVSLSRASWLAAIAAVACVVIFSRGEVRRRTFVVSLVLVVAVGLVATVLYGPTITARFDSIFHPTATTVRTSAGDKLREAEWSDSWRVFQVHPVTGIGFGNLVGQLEASVVGTNSASQAQSTYLQFLAEGGVFGGAVLLLAVGGVGADLWRSRRDWLSPALIGSFVAVLATWVTDYTIRYMSVMGLLAVLIGLAASGSSPPDDRQEADDESEEVAQPAGQLVEPRTLETVGP